MERIVHTVKWKDISGFPGYKISNSGLVRNANGLMTLKNTKRNRTFVGLRNGVVYQRWDIHKLVWDHFGDGTNSKSVNIHHKDFDPLNNHIDNLELLDFEDHWDKHRERSRLKK